MKEQVLILLSGQKYSIPSLQPSLLEPASGYQSVEKSPIFIGHA